MREKIIDRLRKLHDHAESAKKLGSEEEAQAFLSKLLQLMAEHNVTEDEFRSKTEPIVYSYFRPSDAGLEVKAQNDCPDWLILLATQIGQTTSCATAAIWGRNWIEIRGRKSDIEQCYNALRYLSLAAMRLAMRSYRTRCRELRALGETNLIRHTRGYKESFLVAFVAHLHERIAAERHKLETSPNAPGLVLLDKKLEEATESLEAADGCTKVPLKQRKPEEINALGVLDGWTEAENQPLRPAGELDRG